MAQFFIMNTRSGEIEREFETMDEATIECSKLNDQLPYFEDKYFKVFDQELYNAWLDLLEAPEQSAYAVYGVGRHSDAYPIMCRVIPANSSSEARKAFEAKYPEYRSISADPV